MKRILNTVILIAVCTALLSLTSLAVTFPDVPRDGSERAKAIYKLADNGIVGGYEDGTFRPDGYLTRAELCKIVNLIFGYTEKDSENFKDVKTTDWYYDYVLVAKKAGYIGGYEDKTFRGQWKLTREQTCKIISITAGLYDLPTTTVVKDKISDWAKGDVMKVIANFVMTPDKNGNFRATENITRAELAMALANFVKEQPQEPVTPSMPSIPAGPSTPAVTKYTVKFYDGDGTTVLNTQTVEKGKSATAPTAIPTKAEDNEYTYTFAGWSGNYTNVNANLSIYPKFNKTEKLYTVTLNYGSGTTGQTVTEIKVTYNGLLSDKLPAAEDGFKNGNKHFAGWYAGSELIDSEKYSDLKPLILTAKWVDTFTVKFYNGDGSLMKTQTKVKYGESATAPSTKPTKATDNYYSYTFKGWDKTFTNVKSDLDVYPVFNETVRYYTITLNYGSGTTGAKPASVSMTYDQPFSEVLPASGFSNGTKHFAGWYLNSELVDVEKYSDLKPTALTAKWVSVFTVKFYDAKGNKIKEEPVKYGESATAPSNPTKAQTDEYTYTFSGWDTDFTSVTQNLDVHPVFDEEERLYEITLNYGAGTTGTMPEKIEVTYNTLLKGALPDDLTNGDKYFAGWYSGSELIDTEKYSDLKPSTLTAKWVDTFTVRFYDANGKKIKEEIVKYGESATSPAAPAKAQDNEYTYTFTGWDTSFKSVTSDLNVYPKYSKKDRLYTVVLDYANGRTDEISMTYNQSFGSVLPTSGFENGGKLFAGWYYGSTLVEGKKYSDLKPDTLTAKWVSNFTVTFYNGNGSVMITRNVQYGGSAKAPSSTPTKAKSNEYTYTFERWDTSFSYVTSDLDVYPIFTETPRTYKVNLSYGSGVEDAITTSITVTYYETLSDKLPEDGFTRFDMLFAGWYDGDELIDSECYADLSSSILTAKWKVDPQVVADNSIVRAELQTVIDEIAEPLSFGFNEHQLWVLEPVVDAIQATLDESADNSRRISKAYVLENHSDYVSLASYRIRNPREFDETIPEEGLDEYIAQFKKNLKYDMANNLSTPSVNFLLDFFDIDIGDYVE
ncbi:MAG: S-layer homology domain-containing protein [Clostridia bacterium]|nr:S-layer homology domain-containing protein [Clostridia bacterium]